MDGDSGEVKVNRVTAVLLNYKRPKNMVALVESLYSQTEPVSILLVDNSGLIEPWNVDRAVYVPWNAGCYARTIFALYAKTDWVMMFDDDLMPNDSLFVEDALRIAKQHRFITGAFGCRLSKTPLHYMGRPNVDSTGPSSMVKGRFMVYRRSLLDSVTLGGLMQCEKYRIRCDDIYLNLSTGHGDPVHWVDVGLRQRLKELPPGRVGSEFAPGHYETREEFCAAYFRAEAGRRR